MAVQVSANNGGGLSATDQNGFYEVWVGYGWSGMVTPEKSGTTFEPNQMTYSDVLADRYDQNYVAGNIYDLDCDGLVGFGDLKILFDSWLMTGTDIPGDFDLSGQVDFIDFADFTAGW